MSTSQTDYLRYSANSVKELLKEKLIASGNFTDQIFQDSNLSVILDTLAYMYSLQIYYLNNTASESMFSDSQLYENMNRIVKMLGYNPAGFITSNTNVSMGLRSSISTGSKLLPPYTTYTSNLNDSKGNPIKYSTVDIKGSVFTVPITSQGVYTSSVISSDSKPTFYNGEWKLYPDILITTGIPFETFTLDKLLLTGDDRVYVAHSNIHVYVQLANGNFYDATLQPQWWYEPTNNLYNYQQTDQMFEVRVNENYQYTLKFGDNINGKMLGAGCKLYVVYLESNGAEGEIGANVLDGTGELLVQITGLDNTFITDNIINTTINKSFIDFQSGGTMSKIMVTNEEASTFVKDFETVDEIRQNAPNWFRMGSRLITEQDFVQYILSTFSSQVWDVQVQNNWTYMIEFQQWLNTYNKLNIDIRHYDYNYSDSCDFNNIYIWVKNLYTSNNLGDNLKRTIIDNCNKLKPLTSELVVLDPFMVSFTPWLGGTYTDLNNFDNNDENKIVLIRDRNTMISVERIKQRATQIIQDFFSLKSNKLGQNVDITSLYNQLSGIDGVSAVKTSYLPLGSPAGQTQYYDGLSFAKWTPHIIGGADLTKVTGVYKLRSFQFPFLLDSGSIGDKITVLTDSFQVYDVEY